MEGVTIVAGACSKLLLKRFNSSFAGGCQVCGFAVRGHFCVVFRFSQNFDLSVYRFLTFLRFAISSILAWFFGFCRNFERFFSS